MSNDKMREAFEKDNPVPKGVIFDVSRNDYTFMRLATEPAHPQTVHHYRRDWHVWQRAWNVLKSQQPESEHWAIKRPGIADQYRQEALAARSSLGFASDADDVSPSDIRREIDKLTSRQRLESEPDDSVIERIRQWHWEKRGCQLCPEDYRDIFEIVRRHAGPQPSAQVPEGWRTALENLLAYAWRQICMHEDTHRGGSIWEICDQCGARWADDEGGRPDFATPPEIEAAEELLAAPSIAEKREWISCEDRLPTEDDTDNDGCVWVFWDDRRPCIDRERFEDAADYKYWMPTGLTRPAPPEEVQ